MWYRLVSVTITLCPVVLRPERLTVAVIEARYFLFESRWATISARVANRHAMVDINLVDASPAHFTDELSYDVVEESMFVTSQKFFR